jgi:hypothetical protein
VKLTNQRQSSINHHLSLTAIKTDAKLAIRLETLVGTLALKHAEPKSRQQGKQLKLVTRVWLTGINGCVSAPTVEKLTP